METKRFYASHPKECQEFWKLYRAEPVKPPEYNYTWDASEKPFKFKWQGFDWEGKKNK